MKYEKCNKFRVPAPKQNPKANKYPPPNPQTFDKQISIQLKEDINGKNQAIILYLTGSKLEGNFKMSFQHFIPEDI